MAPLPNVMAGQPLGVMLARPDYGIHGDAAEPANPRPVADETVIGRIAQQSHLDLGLERGVIEVVQPLELDLAHHHRPFARRHAQVIDRHPP